MKPVRKYATAAAFRVALETRLKRYALEQGVDLQRVRREVAFQSRLDVNRLRLIAHRFASVLH